MATLGRNISFPIKNADDSSFHGLVLRKATVDSVVMSLGDKITGDAYYKNNHLECTMQEYVEYNDVKYTLVNPPTIVREGLVSDNSDLKGMTKYSFEFYHPMYILANLPFSDVAVSDDEKRYLSENKTFNWIGKPQDYIDKINKNLEGTEWIVVKSGSFPEEKDDELSEVLSFDNNTIADALKTGYETWGLPYVVSQIKSGEQYYSNGKRFKVEFGLPSNEIVVNNENFVFQFGKDVGLKNNSRTPRNNKIITRIAGYGSENNIPYGYPQIRWYGNQNWKYTINSNSADPNSYPIYDGIVGGAVVKLIKHPFTRTHLMPSVYSESVFNKVSPYLSDGSTNPNYDPDIELKDYYDAVSTQDWQYVNEINLLAPSYESHEFDIKPEMDDGQSNVTILGATPLNDDLTPASGWDDSIDDDGEYVQSYFQLTLPTLSFDLYACAAITEEMQVNMRSGACLGCTFTVYVDWEDYKSNFYDSDGNFLPNGEQRDLTKYPKSNLGSINIVVQKDTNTFGTLMPNRYQYPSNGNEFVVLGISLPQEYITNAEQRLDDEMKSYMLENNVYYYDYPLKFDEAFLYNHTEILEQIHPNTIIRFGFGGNVEPLSLFVKQLTIKYGEGVLPQYDITLTDNIEIVLNQLGQVADSVEKLSSLVALLRQTYNRNIWSELEKKLSKVKDDSTPYKLGMRELDVSDNASIHKNTSVGNNLTVEKDATVKGDLLLNGAASRLAGGKTDGEIPDYSGIMEAFINFLHSDNYTGDGAFDTGWMLTNRDTGGNSYLVVDNLFVRMKAFFTELEIRKISYAGGNIIFSHAGSVIVEVRPIFAYDPTGESIQGQMQGSRLLLSSDSENEAEMMNIGETTTETVREPYIVRHYEYDEETGEETITEETLYNEITVVKTPLNLGGDTSVVNSILSFSAEAEAYRCYIKKDDGTTSTENWWRVDDQARCQTFNIEEGTHYNVSNTFYWRRVVAVGSEIIYKGEDDTEGETYDYIDLSASDCITGSTIPAAGDNVVQMGNRTVASRQGFIAMEVAGENAPAIKIYRNVNSYSLDGKMPIILSPYKTEIRARRFITETDYDVQPVPLFRGAWSDITDSQCYYYDEVTHNGSSWICTYPESGINGVMYTTEEPSINATYWQIRAAAGESIQKLNETYRYALSTDGSTPSGSWVDNKPTVPKGQWLLTETTITWSSGNPTVLVSAERNPNDGESGMSVTITSQSVTYAKTSSAARPSVSAFGDYPASLTKGDYLHSKTTVTYSDGTSTNAYSVSYIGEDGTNGTNGTDGRGVSTVTEYYAASASNSVAPSSFSTSFPSDWDANKKYLWNYEETTYTSGSPTITTKSVIAVWSEDGKGLDSVTNYYLVSQSSTGVTRSTSGWTTTIQTVSANDPYLWNYEKLTWILPSGSNDYTYTDPHVIGHYGRDGEVVSLNDDETSYRYLVADSGTSVPTASDIRWTSTRPTVAQGKWLWTETTLHWSDGTTTALYSAERNGVDGVAGQTVHLGTQTMRYAVTDDGANHPAENSESWDTTYTPVQGKWLWTKITTPYTYTDSTSAGSTVTYQVTYIAEDGESIEGRGISSVTEYYKLHTASTGVNNEQTHGDGDTLWSTTVKTATEALPYLWNYELISYTDSTSSKTPATVIGNFSADGKGIDEITNYYKASSNQTESRPATDGTNGWTTSIQTISENAIYLWNYEKVEYTDGTSAYTDPHIIGHWGRDGLTTAQLILNPAVVHVPCYSDGSLIDNFYAEVSMRMNVNGTQISLSEKTVTEEYTTQYVTEEPNAEMMIFEDGTSVSGAVLTVTSGASVSGSLLTLNGSYYPSFNKLYVNITGGTVDERTVEVSAVGHDEDGNAYYCYATLGIQRQYIVRDAINIPEYHQQRYAWSAAVSTQDQTTPPDDISETDWSSSTPAQVTGKPYLWLEDTLMVWDEENYRYEANTPIYTRLSGENGTGVAIKGSIPSTTSTPEAWLVANVSNPDAGDSYIYQSNGHLYVYNGSVWQDVGQIKGDNGTTQYVHIAWADVLGSNGYPTSGHFFTEKAYNQYYPYMGVYVDANAGQDSSNAYLYTWSEVKGDANVVVTIENENDSVPCTYDGKVETRTILSTNVHIWYGTEELPPSSITISGAPSGTYAAAIRDDDNILTGEVHFDCPQGVALDKVTELTITVSAYRNGTLYARNVTFTANGIRAAEDGVSPSLYRLVPSTPQVVKTKSGSYLPSANVSCSVTKNVGGVQSTPAASEYSLMMKVNGGSEEAYEPVPPSAITSGIEYILRVGGVVADRQTVSLISDGSDGDDAVVVTLNRTAVIFTQSLTSDTITFTPTYEDVTVNVTKGETPQTPSKIEVTGTSHINTSGITISGRTVRLYASGINTYQENNKNYPYESGYVDIRVEYNSKTYDHRINFYVNALGKFKTVIEGDVEETIANKTYHTYNADGTVSTSMTLGEFIRSSSQNTSSLTEEVNGVVTNQSTISQQVNSISLAVYESKSTYNILSPNTEAVSLNYTSPTTIPSRSFSSTGGGRYFYLSSPITIADNYSGTITFRFVGMESRTTKAITVTFENGLLTATSGKYADYTNGTLRLLFDFGTTETTSFSVFAQVNNQSIVTLGANRTMEIRTSAEEELEDLKDDLVETGIDIENRKITFTADTIKINNNAGIETAGFDKNGNFSIAGVINSKIITITTSNASDYGSYNDGILRLNPLLISDVMITAVNSICLPIAFTSTATAAAAEIYAWGDSVTTVTMDDLRRCVGKKIYVLPSSTTAQLMFYAGDNAREIAPLLVKKTEYIGGALDLNNTSPGSARYLSTEMILGYQFGGSGSAGYFHVLECKMGVYNQHECIYWEIQTMAQLLDET